MAKTKKKAEPKKTPNVDKPWQFQPGNQFWNLRSKHGRDKLFSTPELLWEAACKYFKWCDDHPWIKTETTTKGEKVEVKETPTQRPYTLEGWCLYCGASKNWWIEFKAAKHHGFLEITTRIDDIIYRQKFEGATVGTFNASIVARDFGLADNQNVKHDGGIKLLPQLSDEELAKLSEIMEK